MIGNGLSCAWSLGADGVLVLGFYFEGIFNIDRSVV